MDEISITRKEFMQISANVIAESNFVKEGDGASGLILAMVGTVLVAEIEAELFGEKEIAKQARVSELRIGSEPANESEI